MPILKVFGITSGTPPSGTRRSRNYTTNSILSLQSLISRQDHNECECKLHVQEGYRHLAQEEYRHLALDEFDHLHHLHHRQPHMYQSLGCRSLRTWLQERMLLMAGTRSVG